MEELVTSLQREVQEYKSPKEELEPLKKELDQIIEIYKDKQDEITDWGSMRGNDDSSKTSLIPKPSQVSQATAVGTLIVLFWPKKASSKLTRML